SVAIQLLNNQSNKVKLKITDLKKLKMISNNQPVFSSLEGLREFVITLLIQEPYSQIWSSVLEDKLSVVTMQKILNNDLKEQTIKRRLHILLDWGQKLGIIPTQKYKY
ncbi:MAG: hypothetical protein ACKO87_08900, partial [Dolichospermum sp.]